MLPFVALDAVAATGPGPTKDLEGVCREFSIVVTATGAPDNVSVVLQGSHDELVWYGIATVPLGAFSPDPGHFTRYVRANLQALSGGTSPTVRVTIAHGNVDKS